MQAAKSIVERITAQAILPMLTMGVSGAILTALLELWQDWRGLAAASVQK